MAKSIDYNAIDKLILVHCFNSLTSGNLFYTNLLSIFNDNIIQEAGIDFISFKSRLYYLIGLEYIVVEPLIIDNIEIISRLDLISIKDENLRKEITSDKELYYKYILFGKINANGIKRYEELVSIIESSKGIKGIYNKIKSFFENIFNYKYIVGLGLTGICLILIFGFDIKVSEYVSKMPLLTSVVDTDTLEQFENINEDDDFYQSIVSEFSTDSNTGTTASATGGILDKSIFQEVKVKKVSSTERMFRIKLPDGKEQYITVKKGIDGKLQVVLPPRLKAIQDKIKKLNTSSRIK